MSAPKHTPGPWALTNSREVFSKASGDPICVVSWGFTPLDRQVAKADARLIAAAPDMLEALNAAYDFIMREYASAEAGALEGDPLSKEARAIRDTIVSAIAKAEGRS